MTNAILSIRDLTTGYRQGRKTFQLQSKLNLELMPGEFICLLGPNGTGKSTLLKTLLGFHPPLAGDVLLEGQSVSRISPRRRAQVMSAVLTDRIQPDHLKVLDLVLLGRYPHRSFLSPLAEKDRHLAMTSLASMNASQFADRQVQTLSDGERQRVFIARALAQDPKLLLLDEPTSFLDLPQRVETFRLLRHWAHNHDRAVLMSSHDLELSLSLADRILLLGDHGKVSCAAPEDLLLSGVFKDIFASEHIKINDENGSIDILMDTSTPVELNGEGRQLAWTRRALRRSGYEITTAADLKVQLIEDHWALVNHGQSENFFTVEDLLRRMKSLPASI